MALSLLRALLSFRCIIIVIVYFSTTLATRGQDYEPFPPLNDSSTVIVKRPLILLFVIIRQGETPQKSETIQYAPMETIEYKRPYSGLRNLKDYYGAI